VLSRCVFITEQEAVPVVLSQLRKSNRLVGRPVGDVVAEATALLEAQDTGAVVGLARERLKRSPEMHDPDFRARLTAAATAATAGGSAGGAVAGVKRPRPEEPAAGGDYGSSGAEAAAAAGSGAGGDGPQPAPAGAAAAAADDAAAGASAFRDAMAALRKALATTAGAASAPSGRPRDRFAASRYAKAKAVFERCCATSPLPPPASASASGGSGSSGGARLLAPNARTYVLLLYAAVAAGQLDDARAVLADLLSGGALPGGPGDLYLHMQPAFIRALEGAGVLGGVGGGGSGSGGGGLTAQALLTAPVGSTKWCFLTAASEAAKGDQQGSKHGAVLRKRRRGGGGAGGAAAATAADSGDDDGSAWEVLATGHNHRYGVPGDRHLRVMHAEVHAMVQVAEARAAKVAASAASAAAAAAAADDDGEPTVAGAECFIVELDGRGVGYEEAAPCSMCQTGLCQLGVAMAHFSSHSGLVSQPVNHKPALQCDTYAMALTRVYPKGSTKPDGGPAGGGELR
jgi:hypothetical protein